MSASRITRRGFVKKAAQLTAGAFALPHLVPASALGKAGQPAPSNRISVGFIGVGTRGKGMLLGFLGDARTQVQAVCDVNQDGLGGDYASWYDGTIKGGLNYGLELVQKHYAEKQPSGAHSGCPGYNDFRDVIARDDIDAVVIATPDHWHVPIALAAARAGMDMYVEKPLGVSLDQDITLRKVVRQYGVVFQYGTQQRSSGHCRFGCELIRNGRLGRIHAIEVVAPGSGPGGSTTPAPVPKGLDYDMWLGPAPYSPYTKDRIGRNATYCAYDNTLGLIAGWGAHPLDLLDWAYGAAHSNPVEFEGTGTIPTEGLYNSIGSWNVTCTYADGVKLTFRDGYPDVTRFHGTEGTLSISRGGLGAQPRSLLKSPIRRDEINLPHSYRHNYNFISAVINRTEPISPIDSAVRSDTISQLANIAVRTGRKIKWDTNTEQIIGDDRAARMLSRSLRSPWHL